MARRRKSGQVDEDETGWIEARRSTGRRAGDGRKDDRGESCKMVQIFVTVNGSRAITMEMALSDKVSDIVKRSVGCSKIDVYVTSDGRVLWRNEELRNCGVSEGSTVEITSRMRGKGKHREKQSKKEKERSGSFKKIEQAQGQKAGG